MLLIAWAAILIALIPSSGATPAWAGLPIILAIILSWPGPSIITSPGVPPLSKTKALFDSILSYSKFFAPNKPTSSQVLKANSIGPWSILLSTITLRASINAAIPALLSAPNIVVPSE